MLSVTLTLTDTDQSAKLLALLETLPFVEIQTRQLLPLSNELEMLEIFNRYLEYRFLGFTTYSYDTPMYIDVFKGINEAVENELGSDEAQALYRAVAQNPGLFEGQLIISGTHKAHCVYRRGYRVLYEVVNKDSTIYVFHVASTVPSVA